MSLKGDLYREKRERAIVTAELSRVLAVLDLTRHQVYRLAAGDRLPDPDVLATSGIEAAVIKSDGRIDLEALEVQVEQLAAGSVGALP